MLEYTHPVIFAAMIDILSCHDQLLYDVRVDSAVARTILNNNTRSLQCNSSQAALSFLQPDLMFFSSC